MTAPLEVTEASAAAVPDAALQGVSRAAIQGRSLGQIAWMRLKRDRVAMTGGVVIIVLILVAVSSVLMDRVFGVIHPNVHHEDLIDRTTLAPTGTFGGISWAHPLGVQPLNGEDILQRVYAGSWISLLIAFLATLLSVVIGTVMGVIAGYFGGCVDAVISRVMDIFLAFPLLVFAVALAGMLTTFNVTGLGVRILVLVFIIGFFNWP